jgi:hypothetical protein
MVDRCLVTNARDKLIYKHVVLLVAVAPSAFNQCPWHISVFFPFNLRQSVVDVRSTYKYASV